MTRRCRCGRRITSTAPTCHLCRGVGHQRGPGAGVRHTPAQTRAAYRQTPLGHAEDELCGGRPYDREPDAWVRQAVRTRAVEIAVQRGVWPGDSTAQPGRSARLVAIRRSPGAA